MRLYKPSKGYDSRHRKLAQHNSALCSAVSMTRPIAMHPNSDSEKHPMVNPYAPPKPEGKGDDHSEYEIPFAATIAVDDVRRASQRPMRVLVTGSIVSLPLLGGGLLTWIMLRSPTGRLPWLMLVMLGLLAFILVLELWFYLGPGLANWRLRAMPRVLGPIHGSISKQWLRWQRNDIACVQRTDGCSYAHVQGSVIEFSLDQRRLSLSFLPERAFRHGDFEVAAKWLGAAATASRLQPAAGVIDARLQDADQIMTFESPDNAVRFRGSLKSLDLLDSPLRATWGKALRRLFLIIAVVDVPLLIGMFRFRPFDVAWIVCLTVFVFWNWRFFRVLSANFGWSRSPDKTIMEIAGAISDREVVFANALGCARYQWTAFADLKHSDTTIAMRLPGTLGHHVIFARHQLEDPDQWAQALTTAQAAFERSRGEPIDSPATELK